MMMMIIVMMIMILITVALKINNCYESNDDNYKITNRLRKTVYLYGPVNHDHKLTLKNITLYEPN
jgi:hypothetical protein